MAESPLPPPPSAVDLAFAIGLPPEEAIAYFTAKGYRITWSWLDAWQEAHAKAFTVAGVTKLDVLADIRAALDDALTQGSTLADFERRLQPLLQAKGWWGANAQADQDTGELAGKGLTPRRLQTIFETNVQTAYSAGRYRDFLEDVAGRPYWQYVAIMDNRTRPSHAALNGRVFRADDPFWDSHYPPNGFRCRCRVRALDQSDVDRRDLVVSSGAGKLSTVQVPTSAKPDAPRVEVTRFEIAPGKYVAPDAGWSYNPGKASLPPDLVQTKLRAALPDATAAQRSRIERDIQE